MPMLSVPEITPALNREVNDQAAELRDLYGEHAARAAEAAQRLAERSGNPGRIELWRRVTALVAD